MNYHLLLLIGISLTVIGQLLLKKAVDGRHISIKEIPRFLTSPYIILGFGAYGTSLLLWLIVLSKLELSYAYPLVSSNYFFITLFSKLLFKEHVSKKRWISIFTIMLGVAIVSLS